MVMVCICLWVRRLATYEKNNTEYDCKAWIRGSGDTKKKSTPQTENLKPQKKLDSQGREYYEDRYDDGFRYAAIKYHPVGHSKPWPFIPPKTRTLSLYDRGVVNRLQDSPSQLDNIQVWPIRGLKLRVWREITIDRRLTILRWN